MDPITPAPLVANGDPLAFFGVVALIGLLYYLTEVRPRRKQ